MYTHANHVFHLNLFYTGSRGIRHITIHDWITIHGQTAATDYCDGDLTKRPIKTNLGSRDGVETRCLYGDFIGLCAPLCSIHRIEHRVKVTYRTSALETHLRKANRGMMTEL